MPMARAVRHWAGVRGVCCTGTARAQAAWGPRMADGGGIDGGARVRLLALVQGVRDLARRAGGNLSEVQLASNPSPVVRAAVDWARGVTLDAPTDDLAILAVRLAGNLANPGTPGAVPNGPSQVRSILSTVRGASSDERPANDRYLPLVSLGTFDEKSLFPVDRAANADEAHRRLWRAFLSDHQILPATHLDAYLEGLAATLQKHGWCVPAGAGRGANDVSAYDQARVTAALASCLLYEASQGNLDLDAALRGEADDHQPFALVGGDISGIQRFLYAVTSSGALRGLRGRSFYLQLLGEAIIRKLLRAWHLPATNVILEGGGHFYLLAPASLVNEHQLDALVGEVTTVLLSEHGTDLFVAIDSVPMSIRDVRVPETLTTRWRELGGRVAEAKRRKGGALLADAQRKLFQPAESAGLGWHWCSVCQGPIRNPEPTDPDDPETPLTEAGRDRKRKCHVCRGMEHVGLLLRRGAVMAVWDWDADADDLDPHAADANLSDDQRWRRTLRRLGTDVLIPQPAEWRRSRRDQDDRVDAPPGTTVTVYRLQDADLDEANKDATRLGARGAGVGFRLLAQTTPLRAGAKPDDPARSDVMDLGDLAEAGPGVKRLGFLRADVDNLGQVFLQGLQVGGKDAGTLARRAALSGSLRLFFEAHLGVLCDTLNTDLRSQSPKQSDQLYLIYSGGDDLFLAGAWDAVVRASVAIHDAFARYAGGSPVIHLSGGLAVVHDKYPVRQAADDAGEALEDAKGRPGKDAVSLFGRTVPWAILGAAQGLADELAKHVADRSGETPRQLLRLALRLCTMETTIGARRAKDKRTSTASTDGSAATDGTAVGSPERQVAWGPWAWQGAYALGRMKKDDRAPKALIEDIRKLLLNADGIDQLFVAATWADLAIRTKTKE